MKRTTKVSIAALLSSTLLAVPAIAQVGIDAESGVNAEIGGTGVGVDTGISGSAGAETGIDGNAGVDAETGAGSDLGIDDQTTASIGASFDGALAAIGHSNTEAISSMSDVASVNVIRIESLEGADMASVDEAVERNDSEIGELRAALESNMELRTQLEQQGVDPQSVVAADVDADGALDVYVR